MVHVSEIINLVLLYPILNHFNITTSLHVINLIVLLYLLSSLILLSELIKDLVSGSSKDLSKKLIILLFSISNVKSMIDVYY